MQILKYKYRLYPTQEQEQLLLQICGSQRYIWNYFLDVEQQEYALSKQFKFFTQNSRDLTELKKTVEWLKDIPAVSLQQTLRNLEKALKQSFKKNNHKKGFPKFKKRKNFTGSFSMVMVNAERNVSTSTFYVNRAIGDVKCVYHRTLPSDFASATIKQEAGKWFVVLTCSKKKQAMKAIINSTGIDLNSKSYVTTDAVYDIPKYLKENQFKIKHMQQELARKTKGSKNKQKCQLKLQKVHQHVANSRKDYFHKLSSTLANSYDLITIEDLDVRGIQEKFGHVVKDNGFGMFRQMLEYKCELYGTTLEVANRYFPSSQKCSACSGLTKHAIHERVYICKHCGYVIDRDKNAAINLDLLGQELANVTPMDVNTSELDVLASVLSGITDEVGSHVL